MPQLFGRISTFETLPVDSARTRVAARVRCRRPRPRSLTPVVILEPVPRHGSVIQARCASAARQAGWQ